MAIPFALTYLALAPAQAGRNSVVGQLRRIAAEHDPGSECVPQKSGRCISLDLAATDAGRKLAGHMHMAPSPGHMAIEHPVSCTHMSHRIAPFARGIRC